MNVLLDSLIDALDKINSKPMKLASISSLDYSCGCTGNCGQSCSGGCETGCSGSCGRSCSGSGS